MPSDSYYSGVTVSAGAVTMQGVTMNEYEVAGFLDSLEANDHIINVNTNGYSKSYTTGIVSFNVSYDILSDELLAAMDTADTTSNESSEEAN
jgi:hypothetical protein